VVALAVPLLVQASQSQREALARYFHPEEPSWGSPESLAALRALAPHIPAHTLVAANPWRGATYLYVVSGRTMLIPTEKALNTPDRVTLAKRLDRVGRSRQVCTLAERLGVQYVIVGGALHGDGEAELERYAGIDGVPLSTAFERVASSGDYTLYRRTACAGG
jgi:hypothetical protein